MTSRGLEGQGRSTAGPCAPPRRPTPGPGRRSAVALAGVAQLPLLSPWSRPAGGGRAHGQLRGGRQSGVFQLCRERVERALGRSQRGFHCRDFRRSNVKPPRVPPERSPARETHGDRNVGMRSWWKIKVFGLGSPERRWLPALRGTVVAVTVVVCGQSRKVEISFGKRTRARRGGGAAPACQGPWSLLSTPSWRQAQGPGRGTCGLCPLTASVGVLPRRLRALGQLRIFSDLNWPSHKTGRKGNRAPRSDAASPRVPWPRRAAGPGDPGAKGSHLRSHSHPRTHTHTHTLALRSTQLSLPLEMSVAGWLWPPAVP